MQAHPGSSQINLLIVNTTEEQPYLLIDSLRHEAKRIVITVPEGGWLKRWSPMSAWSRYVDKRYTVPGCGEEWLAGRISRKNSAAEEAYILRLEEIIRAEAIDVIYPSYDAEVYVLSKNRDRLSALGALAVVPPLDVLARVLDKSITLEAARKVGFPIPPTAIPDSLEALNEAADQFGPPWVLKARCDAHALNLRSATTRPELELAFKELHNRQERPVLQEYVPTRTKQNFYMVVDQGHNIVSLMAPRVHRLRRTGLTKPCAAVETVSEVPLWPEVQALIRELGIWGGFNIQTIVDDRDGVPRLLEINPRFGHNLWYQTELGINAPLINLRIARNEPPGEVAKPEAGVLLLDPLLDLFHLLGQTLDQAMARLRGRKIQADERADYESYEPLGGLISDLRRDYLSRRPRITNRLNRGWLSDPLPPAVRIINSFVKVLRRRSG